MKSDIFRCLKLPGVIAAAAMSVVLLTGSERAGACDYDACWTHGLDRVHNYYMPGPPPGPELSVCYVATSLLKRHEGDIAHIVLNPSSTHPSACVSGWVQIVTVKDGRFVTKHAVATDARGAAQSVGDFGHAIFGARFGAMNAWGGSMSWEVSVF